MYPLVFYNRTKGFSLIRLMWIASLKDLKPGLKGKKKYQFFSQQRQKFSFWFVFAYSSSFGGSNGTILGCSAPRGEAFLSWKNYAADKFECLGKPFSPSYFQYPNRYISPKPNLSKRSLSSNPLLIHSSIMTERLEQKQLDFSALVREENDLNFRFIYEEALNYGTVNDNIWIQAKEIKSQSQVARHLLHSLNMEEAQTILDENFEAVKTLLQFIQKEKGNNPEKYATLHENSSITQALEEYLTTYFLQYFIFTGSLAPITDKRIEGNFSNTVYLSASLNLPRELTRFAVNQAADGNTSELFRSKKLADALNDEFIQFKWPNGNLRKKFDAIKYDIKNLEEYVYQLSLVTSPSNSSLDSSLDPSSKNEKDSTNCYNETTTNSLVFSDSFEIFRNEMDEYEDVRSTVIKGVRDAQKNAKNSIHLSLQGKLEEAEKLLQNCSKDALKFEATIKKYPNLRSGAYGNVLEEYGEGMLVLKWRKEERLATLGEIKLCSTFEYMGALSDFTGELQRLAVKFATARDLESVRKCLLIANYVSILQSYFSQCMYTH